MIDTAYDVVIIGAGVGGLTCGAFLAREGLKVLVAERNPVVGGCCHSFRAGGFRFDAAVHHVSGGGGRSLIGRALSSLGASVRFVKLDPMDTLLWPDESFVIPGSWEGFISSLTSRFPVQSAGIEALFLELLRLYRAVLGTAGGRASLERWRDSTFLQFLTSFVDDEFLIRILSGQWGYLGAPPHRLSTVGMCQMLVNYWRDGTYYPLGGTQAIPDALAAVIGEAGGTIATSCAVKRVIVDRERALGVELINGDVVRADRIVSNVDVPQTVQHLLGGTIDDEYRTTITRLEVSAPFFLVYLGLDRDFNISRLPRGFYHRADKLGSPWFYVSSASQVDSPIEDARHGITVVASLNSDESGVMNWNALKDEKVREIVRELDQFVPGLAQHVEFARGAHPPNPSRQTSNFCGAPYGWAVIPGQSGDARLSTQTPISNLKLVGHWTTPGPGVCAVIASGWRVAKEISCKATNIIREPRQAAGIA